MLIFAIKGAASYGQAVMMSRIGNRIIAENQQRMFDRLMRQSLGFFAARHSSEFLARLSTGANSATQVLNLLVTAIGRDFLSLVGLVLVMVYQDPVMSLFALVIAPPALFVLRKLIRRVRTIAKSQFTGGTHLFETMQETIQGIRIVKTFTLEDADACAHAKERRRGREPGQQDGARRQSLEPADGDRSAASRLRWA